VGVLDERTTARELNSRAARDAVCTAWAVAWRASYSHSLTVERAVRGRVECEVVVVTECFTLHVTRVRTYVSECTTCAWVLA
jgi:hypothetical protein